MNTIPNLPDVDTTQEDREALWRTAMHGVETSALIEAVAEAIATSPEDSPLSYEADRLLADLPEPDFLHVAPSTCEYAGRWVLGLIHEAYTKTLETTLVIIFVTYVAS